MSFIAGTAFVLEVTQVWVDISGGTIYVRW